MRFVPDGPMIPNDLVGAWRQGKVLFLAGAGVSEPAGLPLFRGLVLDVYRELGDALAERLSGPDDPEARARLFADAAFSPKQNIEAELYYDNQIDRLFSAMEARYDHDKNGRLVYYRVRDAVEKVLRGVTKCAQGHRDLLQLSAPQEDDDGVLCRIATTNFDLLFEKAWRLEFGAAVPSHDARVAPRAGAHNFEGVVHLHGKLHTKQTVRGEMVLSSRDFARFYLRSGVAANYIYDLLRRYTLVLVGYSADDPPMRYLMDAIGEDASLFSDMKKPFAIADRHADGNDPDGVLAVERWNAKNIIPILFVRRPGNHAFAPMWESIHAWANWARHDQAWVQQRLVENTREDFETASAFARSFVQDLLGLLNDDERDRAIRHLHDVGVDFGWIEAVEAAFRSVSA